MSKIKNYKIEIITYLILTIFFIGSWFYLWYIHGGRENKELDDLNFNKCKEYLTLNEEEKENFADLYKEDINLSNEWCSFVVSNPHPDSAFSIYRDFIIASPMKYIIPYFFSLIILFPFIYFISKEFRSKNIKNCLVRENYKKYITSLFKRAYKFIWVPPLLFIIIYIICAYASNWNFNVKGSVNWYFLDSEYIELTSQTIFFYISYIVVIILNIGMYINLGLIVLSKNKNFIIAFIESYLLIYIFWAIVYIFLGNLIPKITNIHSYYFNLLDIFRWGDISNIKLYLIVNIICYLFTFVIAILSYRNKEKLIMMCEK